MQLDWLMMLAVLVFVAGAALCARLLLPDIIAGIRFHLLPPPPRLRYIVGCLVSACLFCGAWVVFNACASAPPLLVDARNDFVKACTALAQAELAETAPSKAERIASKVCLAEKMGETIEREVVADADGLGLFTPNAPDAGAR